MKVRRRKLAAWLRHRQRTGFAEVVSTHVTERGTIVVFRSDGAVLELQEDKTYKRWGSVPGTATGTLDAILRQCSENISIN